MELHIPAGHLPPPGLCRIWFPGRPPGQQPPPGDCAELAQRVPPGAWLVSRPPEERGSIYVTEYHPQHPAVEIAIRVFDAASGRYVRDLKGGRGGGRDGDRRERDDRGKDRDKDREKEREREYERRRG